MNNLAFVRQRIGLKIHELGRDAVNPDLGQVGIRWRQFTGGTEDPTGAIVGAEESLISGSIFALVHSAAAKNVIRQFAEIQTGDQIIDMVGNPVVKVSDGSEVPLSGVLQADPVFTIAGVEYVQRDVSSKLSESWDAVVNGIKLSETLLLRKNT